MGDLKICIAAALPADFHSWLDTGKALLTERSQIEWKLADWIAEGREQFGHQAEFDFLADELGIAPKKLKAAAHVAKAFPPAMRDQTLTFGHYEAVATLPCVEALSVLKAAKAEHLDDRETRIAAVRRQTEISDRVTLPDDDWDHHALMAITRAWNRAMPSVRAEFMDLATEADGGVIDA